MSFFEATRACRTLFVLLFLLTASAVRAAPANNPKEHFALLVGVDKYAEPALDVLQAPRNDVALIRKLLVTRYGFRSDAAHMIVLAGKAASHDAILKQFRTFLIDSARSHPAAEIVFYYSGHGSRTADGLHQTIVPSDARVDGVHDIRDDELSALFDELRHYTTNITFIFDSCYSSTLIKAADRRLIARTVPPEREATPPITPGTATPAVSSLLGGGGNRNDAYVAISASLPVETAFEDCVVPPLGTSAPPDDCGSSFRRFGVLSYALYQILWSDPGGSYHDAMNKIAASIAQRVAQHANVQGDIERPLFGTHGDRDDPYIAVAGRTGNLITVAAGRTLGLQNGAFLAIYSPATKRLRGDTGKLADARVVRVDDFTADVALDKGVRAASIPLAAKVAMVAPNFASRETRIRIPASDVSAPFAGRLKAAIASNPLLALAADGRWSLSVGRGCPKADGSIDRAPSCVLHYVATPDRDLPLFGAVVTGDDAGAVQRLLDVMTHEARQRNLRALVNARSPYNGLIRLRIVPVAVAGNANAAPPPAKAPLDSRRLQQLRLGDYFRLQIENRASTDVNVVLIDLGTGGAIQILSPRGTALHIPAGQVYTTSTTWQIEGQPGTETFRLIAFDASQSPVPDFSVLEQPTVATLQAKALASPLSWLVAQSVLGTAKEARAAPTISLSSWTTDQVDVEVLER